MPLLLTYRLCVRTVSERAVGHAAGHAALARRVAGPARPHRGALWKALRKALRKALWKASLSRTLHHRRAQPLRPQQDATRLRHRLFEQRPISRSRATAAAAGTTHRMHGRE